MKKNIITAGIIAAIAIVAFLNVNVALKSERSNSLAEVMLASIEALARSEDDPCPGTTTKRTGYTDNPTDCEVKVPVYSTVRVYVPGVGYVVELKITHYITKPGMANLCKYVGGTGSCCMFLCRANG
jgi:hypothetical protein